MTRNLKLISAGIGVAAMIGVMGASSFANFTTQNSDGAANNSFKAGNLSVAVTGGTYGEMAEKYTHPGAGNFDMIGNMSPGDTWTKTLTITNNGTLPEIYQVSVASTGLLFQHMQFSGNGVLSNYYPATVGITGDSGAVTLISGAQDQNPQTSSQWVEVDPKASDVLAVSVHLPYAANNAYQNASGSFVINVNAQQADNSQKAGSAIQLNSGE